MSDDKAVRLEALNSRESFLVQAPAGSGKTELLIQRYLNLLAHCDSPEAVVAITFTRKAAAEMRARVLDALRRAEAGARPESDHQALTLKIASQALQRGRGANWGLGDNPSRMRIETIDSLCASITRQMPWLARFGAPPEVTEKAGELYREAARQTLGLLAEEERSGIHGPLSILLTHLDNQFTAAERLLAAMLEKRDQWLRLTVAASNSEQARAELEETLRELLDGELLALRKSSQGLGRELPEALEGWVAMAEEFLTTTGTVRRRGLPESIRRFLESHSEFVERLHAARKLPPARYDDSQWEVAQAAVDILPKAVAHLRLVFRERGTVDFTELSLRALEALGQLESPSDLALALGERMEHLLVDEFQDTSYTQYELLLRLTAGWMPGDGRTLFLVGDPMQSIYRFREADVSLFLNVRRSGLGALRLKPLSLTSNFRSDRSLTEWVNQTFSAILPGEDLERGAVAATPSNAMRKPSGGAGWRVHAFPQQSAELEAQRIVSLIQDAGEGSIAVLVRARGHLSALVPMLRQSGIPFQAIEIDQLGQRPLIQDLMALTFALLHLGDRISWLAALRAPWCGLTLEDLHGIAGGDSKATIWDLLHRKDLHLSADGAPRAARVLRIFESAVAKRGRTGLRRLVEQTWCELGGPACVREESDLADADAYFDLLEGLEKGGDIADFELLRAGVKELYAQPDSRSDGRLQLMTIHKAKGLEFDTVIVPGLGQQTRQDDGALLLWQEREGRLLLAPIKAAAEQKDKLYSYVNKLEKARSRNETARLLYVAVTRARNCLHLLGCAGVSTPTGEMSAPKDSFLELLWPVVSSQFQRLAAGAGHAAPAPVGAEDTQLPGRILRLPITWRVPEPPPEVRWRKIQVKTAASQEIGFDWPGETPRVAGTVLHALLQRAARDGLDRWRGRLPELGSIGAALLRNLGVPGPELAEAEGRVRAALSATMRDPRAHWILSGHEDARSEYAITGMVDGKVYSAVMDRTFVDEAGVRWIIDYKTSWHEAAGLDDFLESEKARYREQLELYARLLAQSEQRPMRLGLYFPLVGAWLEWAAPTVLRKQASLFE